MQHDTEANMRDDMQDDMKLTCRMTNTCNGNDKQHDTTDYARE